MSPENSYSKTSVEDRLLASIELINASQACALLRIETDDPEGAIQAMARECAIVTLTQNDRAMVPLFQFDTELGRVFDVVCHVLMLRPSRISNLRLAYWMTRAHADFGCAPAQRFGNDDVAIVDALGGYIEPNYHG